MDALILLKKLLLFIPLIAFAQVTQNASYYQLLDANGTILEIFVATPDVAATYPACVLSIYPNAVSCIPYTYPTPLIVTTNNVATPAVTTNNLSITTNNSQ